MEDREVHGNLSRSLSRSLARSLAGTPGTLGRALSARSLTTSGATSLPTARSDESIRELNRERVEVSRRLASAERLTSALESGSDSDSTAGDARTSVGFRLGNHRVRIVNLGCVIFVLALVLSLFAFLLYFIFSYARAWKILVANLGSACDQTVEAVLFISLVLPVAVWVNIYLMLRGIRSPSQLTRLLDFISSMTWLTLYFVSQDEEKPTSGDCDPSFRADARTFSVCGMVLDVLVPCFASGIHNAMVAIAMAAGPGPARAARANLIDEIQSVPYTPDVRNASSECPVCQVEFDAGEMIKRTPCKHYFHEQCLGQWLEGFGKTCPICRADLEEAVDSTENEALVASDQP